MASLRACAPAPPDTVSSLAWLDGAHVAAADWSGGVRVFAAGSGAASTSFAGRAAVLALAADGAGAGGAGSGGAGVLLYGGLDGAVTARDVATAADSAVGAHADAVRALALLPELSLVLSASWDGTLCAWDARARGGGGAGGAAGATPVARAELPGKAFALSAGGHTAVVATAGRRVLVFDVRKLGGGGGGGVGSGGGGAGAGAAAAAGAAAVVASRDSSLKHQTRSVAVLEGGRAWATGSTEGRVAVDWVDDPPPAGASAFAFKCHRRKAPAGAPAGVEEDVFPVHALAAHPRFACTLATGGGDGGVAVWDTRAKKRLAAVPAPLPPGAPPAGAPPPGAPPPGAPPPGAPVTALAFSPIDGRFLAIAGGYDWAAGDAPPRPGAVVVRDMPDADVRPKAGA